MGHFRGSGLKSMILFTVVVHLVVLIGSSAPFIWKEIRGADTSGMDEEQRIDSAVREATKALREIAEDHNLSPQDISSRFAGGGPRAAKTEEPEPPADQAEPPEPQAEPGGEESQYQKNLETEADGPTMPAMEDDIF
jgi:hypothetical protein